jgi:hypothetical protein
MVPGTVKIYLTWFFCALFFYGCDNNPAMQYGDTVTRSYKATEKKAGALQLQKIQEAVAGFRAANGRAPADLKELEDFFGSKLDTALYQYDPESGTVALKP